MTDCGFEIVLVVVVLGAVYRIEIDIKRISKNVNSGSIFPENKL